MLAQGSRATTCISSTAILLTKHNCAASTRTAISSTAGHPTNTDTDIPKVSVDDRNGNRRVSTRFLEDGSYLRIRNITLGYNSKTCSEME
jgi:hypothetical protein